MNHLLRPPSVAISERDECVLCVALLSTYSKKKKNLFKFEKGMGFPMLSELENRVITRLDGLHSSSVVTIYQNPPL
jgi:hypothetical protein